MPALKMGAGLEAIACFTAGKSLLKSVVTKPTLDLGFDLLEPYVRQFIIILAKGTLLTYLILPGKAITTCTPGNLFDL